MPKVSPVQPLLFLPILRYQPAVEDILLEVTEVVVDKGSEEEVSQIRRVELR